MWLPICVIKQSQFYWRAELWLFFKIMIVKITSRTIDMKARATFPYSEIVKSFNSIFSIIQHHLSSLCRIWDDNHILLLPISIGIISLFFQNVNSFTKLCFLNRYNLDFKLLIVDNSPTQGLIYLVEIEDPRKTSQAYQTWVRLRINI